MVTKLLYRNDTGRFKKPLLLPCVHPDVNKLILEEHLRYGHAGRHFLVNKLREKFSIIYAKKAVNRVINKCTICIRFAKRPVTVPVAPLPENRVKNAKVQTLVLRRDFSGKSIGTKCHGMYVCHQLPGFLTLQRRHGGEVFGKG